MSIKSLMHIGIYCHDVKRAIEFYTEILGFELTWQGKVKLTNGEVDVATVTLNNCSLELVTPVDRSQIKHIDGSLQHLALEVDDLENTIEELAEKRIEITEGVSEISYEGGLKHCFIRGVENERIELVQRLRNN